MVLEYLVNKSCNEVLDYLTDPQKFCSVHPVIYKIEEKPDKQILIYERMPFLFMGIKFTYPASIVRNGDTVRMKAVVMKMAHIDLHFKLEAQAEKTKVKETIAVKSFLPIHFIMDRIFKKQHKILFDNIAAATSCLIA